jgi:hypothetical protein
LNRDRTGTSRLHRAEHLQKAERLQRAVRVLKQASSFGSARDRRAWRAAHRVADDATPKFVNTLLLNVRDTKSQVNVANLSRQVASGNVTGIQRALIKPGLNDDLRRLYRGQIQDTLNEAGVASVKLQPKVLAATFGRFDLTNPRAVEWARTKAATLVVAIEESTMQTIRTVIADGIQNGVPVRTTARKLRQSIGLTSRQWQSVNNFEDKLIRAGASRAAAEKGAERFSKVVLRRRAENIARTETIAAGFQGRTELWDQAHDRGLIDRAEVKRKWIVTPDDRLDKFICLPMSGQTVGMEQPFITGQGNPVPGPPAHPQCRCDVILVIPGDSIFDDPTPRSASRAAQEGGTGIGTAARVLTPGGRPAVTTPGAVGSQVPAGTTASTTITPPSTQVPAGRRALRARPGEEPLTLPTGPPRPAPGPAAVTPEEVFTRHPNLESMRGNLIVEDFTDFRVREVVDDLALLSDNILKQMADKGVQYQVTATKTIPEMLGSPSLGKKRPPGWKSGTWKDVRGGYFSRASTGESKVLINVNKTGGSSSVALHEYGHAIGDKLGLNFASELKAANIRNLDGLPKYFTQGGKRGTRGRREMLAESTAMWHKPIGNLTGKQRVAAFVDEDFANWLDKQLR